MNRFIVFTMPALIAIGFFAAVFAQEDEKPKPRRIRKVQRVAKPKFDDSKDDIYFKDLFSEGLVGDRPSSAQAQIASPEKKSTQSDSSEAQGSGWSILIDGATIEDEIKSLNQQLAKSVTTPVKFKTAYNDVRQTMSLLSMSFAIIREYEGEVRWKDHAAAAQAALQQAATNARSNSDQAFNYCKARKFDLEDLIRGGSFAEIEKFGDELEWADVIGRSETMKRLETSDELLKMWTADEATFARQKDKIITEAQWVASIGAVIAKEGMDDADVEEYVAFCNAMKDAAVGAANSAKNDDYEAAAKFANLISQSCNNCHEEWR